jgi:hypothetical protein
VSDRPLIAGRLGLCRPEQPRRARPGSKKLRSPLFLACIRYSVFRDRTVPGLLLPRPFRRRRWAGLLLPPVCPVKGRSTLPTYPGAPLPKGETFGPSPCGDCPFDPAWGFPSTFPLRPGPFVDGSARLRSSRPAVKPPPLSHRREPERPGSGSRRGLARRAVRTDPARATNGRQPAVAGGKVPGLSRRVLPRSNSVRRSTRLPGKTGKTAVGTLLPPLGREGSPGPVECGGPWADRLWVGGRFTCQRTPRS